MQKIIVDGYNVIHADPDLRQAVARSIEAARMGLIGRLSEYVEAKRVQITVVFDGAGFLSDGDAPVPGRLQVLYSASGETADDVIVKLLHGHANPREYIVVTSDMADIGRSVRAIGVTVMPSSDFLQRIAPREEPPKEGGEPERGSESTDVDYWLERFERRVDDDD